ncbi:MAG: FeoA family protein [Candidatus Asgardarchaeia archaeon]
MTLREIPLCIADVGHSYIVTRMSCGRGLMQRLISLGITPGVEVEVINKSPLGGRMVLRVGNSRIALSRGISSKIFVVPKS